MSRRVLLIDAHPADDADRHLVASTVSVLEAQGHTVEVHHLADEGFRMAMSSNERRAYETDEPLQADDTRRAAAAIAKADALVFCVPTSMYSVPPLLKGWLDRVLVLGVGFQFRESGRIGPGMRNIRRIGVVTTTRHDRRTTARHRDLTHRTLGRTLWLSCSRRCRRTFVRIPAGSSSTIGREAIVQGFSGWNR